jgi:hypothetical protein
MLFAIYMFFLSLGSYALADLNNVTLGDIDSHSFVKCAIAGAISLTPDHFGNFAAVNSRGSDQIATLMFVTRNSGGVATIRDLSIRSTDPNGWQHIEAEGDRPVLYTRSADPTAVLTKRGGDPEPVNVDISSCN